LYEITAIEDILGDTEKISSGTPDPIRPTRRGPDPNQPMGFLWEIFFKGRGVISWGCRQGAW